MLFIDYQVCGSNFNTCYSKSGNAPLSLIIPVVVVICFILICACIAMRRRCSYEAQRGRFSNGYRYPAPGQQPRYVQQQQHSVRRTPVVTYANPSAYVHNAAPIHNIREDVPPSYDAITRDTRYNAPVPSKEPPYSSYQGANFRV